MPESCLAKATLLSQFAMSEILLNSAIMSDNMPAVIEPAKPAESASPWTADVLREMRKLGMPKPSEVTDQAWNLAVPEPQELRGIARVRKTISDAINAKASPLAGDKTLIRELSPLAVQTIAEIMLDPNESGRTRLAAASYAFDQASGKANQEVSVTGNFQLDWRRDVAEYDAAKKAREVAATTEGDVAETRSVVENFLSNQVGSSDTVVGRRSEESEQDGE